MAASVILGGPIHQGGARHPCPVGCSPLALHQERLLSTGKIIRWKNNPGWLPNLLHGRMAAWLHGCMAAMAAWLAGWLAGQLQQKLVDVVHGAVLPLVHECLPENNYSIIIYIYIYIMYIIVCIISCAYIAIQLMYIIIYIECNMCSAAR